MPEYRVDGVTISGKAFGYLSADTKRIAKTRATELAHEKKFKVVAVRERTSFIYRVQKGTDKPIDGEQKAFSADEVRIALEKMGFRVLYVRKKLFGNKQRPAPSVDVIAFIRVSTDLMRQKLPFNEVMQLLLNDIPNATLRDAVREVNAELKQGKDSEKVFQKQSIVFGKFAANMLGLASKSGNMVEIYESTAKFLERTAEFKSESQKRISNAHDYVVCVVPCRVILCRIYFSRNGRNVCEIQNQTSADDCSDTEIQRVADEQYVGVDVLDDCSDYWPYCFYEN